MRLILASGSPRRRELLTSIVPEFEVISSDIEEIFNAQLPGIGERVSDLAAQKAWYQDKLGMKALRSYDREGKPFEWIMGYEGGGAILALLASPQRKPGPNTNARLILNVPDAKALAEWLKTQGVESRMVAAGAYFINDPEGNPIELYTPPAPAPK